MRNRRQEQIIDQKVRLKRLDAVLMLITDEMTACHYKITALENPPWYTRHGLVDRIKALSRRCRRVVRFKRWRLPSCLKPATDTAIKYAMLPVVIGGIVGLGLLELAGLLVKRVGTKYRAHPT